MAVQPESHDIDAAHPQPGIEAAPLRQIADVPVRTAGRLAKDPDLAAGERQKPEDDLHQRRLADSVRTEHSEELSAADLRADAAPDQAIATPGRGVADLDGQCVRLE